MGSIYKRGRKWWIAYCRNGRQFCETTRTDDYEIARDILKRKEGDIANGLPIHPKMNRICFKELAQDLESDYTINQRRTLYDLKIRLKEHLLPVFEHRRVWTITTADIQQYVKDRQKEQAKNATINRELSAMKRAFRLAIAARKLVLAPHIPMLKESNVRTGFFERADLDAIRRQLPGELAALVLFAYLTGWRIDNVRTLEWQQVDFQSGTVRLEVGTTKNDEGVVFPMTKELRSLLEDRWAQTETVQTEKGELCPRVFHRGGRPIKDFRKAWALACAATQRAGRIVHDFRRTAVRNLINAGVRERVAMQMTGHKTRSVFDRYHIVSPEDLAEAGRKLEATTTISTTVEPMKAGSEG